MLLVKSCLSILSWFRCHQKVIYTFNLNEYKMPNPDHSFGMTIYWYLGALFWITILNISTTWISWLQSPSEMILESKKVKSVTVSIVSPSICMKWWGQMPWSSFFKCWVLSQLFTLLFHFHHRLFSSSFFAIRVVSSVYLRLLIFLLAILIPVCASSSPAFHILYSALSYILQPWN